MPGAGMPRKITQCRKSMGTLYVQEFLVTDNGGSEGKGTAAQMRHLWNAHAIGSAHQKFPYGAVQSKYTDEVAETRRGDSGKLHGGDFQFNRGRRSGVFRGGRLLQVFRLGTTSKIK